MMAGSEKRANQIDTERHLHRADGYSAWRVVKAPTSSAVPTTEGKKAMHQRDPSTRSWSVSTIVWTRQSVPPNKTI
jgi:hypothetical protein